MDKKKIAEGFYNVSPLCNKILPYTRRARLDNYGVNMGLNQIFLKEEQIVFKTDPWDISQVSQKRHFGDRSDGIQSIQLFKIITD